jgi:general secretion pathway protein F
MTQALRFAAEDMGAGAVALAAQRMREAVDRGETASSALVHFTGAPAKLLRGVIAAGEASGRMAQALRVAGISFARAADLREKALGAMIYPAFVLAMTAATLLVFLVFVVPSLADVLGGDRQSLPIATRVLLSISTWMRADGPPAALLLLAAGLLASRSGKLRSSLAAWADGLAMHPLGAGVAPRLHYASFARLAALSIEAGVPSAIAFETATAGVGSEQARRSLLRAAQAIRVGAGPSEALVRFAHPPRTLVSLMRIGEQSGRMAESLNHAADLMAAEAEERLRRLGAAAGPAVTLFLGAMIGGVVLSLFLGLMAMTDASAL